MADYSTTALLAKAKLWGAVPTGQPAFSNANILDIMTDELITNISPFVIQFREENFVASKDFTIASGTSEYAIPSRATGGVLREVKLIDSEDNEVDIPRINPQFMQNHDFGFYLKGTKLVLIEPGNYTSYTLRMYYYLRPSTLKATSDCATVATVGTTTFTVNAIPSGWTSGDTVDIVRAIPPFDLLSQDITATWAGTTVTPSTMPTGLAVGDYLCQAEETPIPKIPVEVFPLLVQATVVRFMEILADNKGMKLAMDKYEQVKKSVTELLSPRVVGEVKKINNYDNFLDSNQIRIQNVWD